MSISVMMVMCLAMKDGAPECNIRAMYSLPTTNDIQMCSNMADAKANDVLLETGKVGWAKGVCFAQDDYSKVVTRTVEFLELKGYKVNFESYKDN